HPEIVSQRIAALYRLPNTARGVLVVPIATLMQRLAPRSFISGSTLLLELRQRFDLGAEQRRLEAAGYRHVGQVQEPGDFAVRGALLDVFPMGSAVPYRIELFDREIDSIRTFDPETQRSAHKVEKVNLLPAREFPLTESAVKAFRNTLRERFPIDPRRCPLYQDIKEGTTPAGIEYYLPLFFDRTETLFDYLGEQTLFVLAENALAAADSFWQQAHSRYDSRAHDIERPILPVAELYLAPDRLREQLNLRLRVEFVAKDSNEHAIDLGGAPAPLLPINRRGEAPAEELKKFVREHAGRVLIAADSAGRREALLEQLAQADLRPQILASWNEFQTITSPRVGEVDARSAAGEGLAPQAPATQAQPLSPTPPPQGGRGLSAAPASPSFTSPLVGEVDARSAAGEGLAPQAPVVAKSHFFITVAALDDGFTLSAPAITVLTERQLYGERAKQSRRRATAVRDPEAVLRDLSELAVGAPIVHVDHGVGRYQGLIKLEVGGGGEFLCIDYAKG
ncbi:MAG TPA: CarD family transcriptional regulator, partial [Rhodanobacteraceae bacterium]|nr:CarD family transcriptional regulator [Rhodanobacteraceae bacterium]